MRSASRLYRPAEAGGGGSGRRLSAPQTPANEPRTKERPDIKLARTFRVDMMSMYVPCTNYGKDPKQCMASTQDIQKPAFSTFAAVSVIPRIVLKLSTLCILAGWRTYVPGHAGKKKKNGQRRGLLSWFSAQQPAQLTLASFVQNSLLTRIYCLPDASGHTEVLVEFVTSL